MAKRCDEALQRFWSRIDRQHDRLWLAAGDGRIDEDGHELRPALLDDEGRDPLAARSHSRELFRDRKDPKVDQREAFNRAWHAYLDRCGLGAVARIVRDYNKYFPMEAELKTDPKTESYLWLGLPWEPKDVPSRDDILERFPLK